MQASGQLSHVFYCLILSNSYISDREGTWHCPSRSQASDCRKMSPGYRDGHRYNHSGRIARNLRLVHLVDLLLVEEQLGVTPVDLLAHEHIEQVRIDVPVQPESAEYFQRFGQRLALLVGPVPGGGG